MKKIAAVALLIASLAACSSSSNGTTTEAGSAGTTAPTASVATLCSERFKEGVIATDVTYMSAQCVDSAGGSHVYGTATTQCADGRVLMWNDIAWAYAGSPLATYQVGAEKVPPAEERAACTP